MRIVMLTLLARGAHALSAVPAAARRLQKIKELESKHALLVESGAKVDAALGAHRTTMHFA